MKKQNCPTLSWTIQYKAKVFTQRGHFYKLVTFLVHILGTFILLCPGSIPPASKQSKLLVKHNETDVWILRGLSLGLIFFLNIIFIFDFHF